MSTILAKAQVVPMQSIANLETELVQATTAIARELRAPIAEEVAACGSVEAGVADDDRFRIYLRSNVWMVKFIS